MTNTVRKELNYKILIKNCIWNYLCSEAILSRCSSGSSENKKQPPGEQPCRRAISTKLLHNVIEIATHAEHLPGEHLCGTVSVCQKSFERLNYKKLLFTVS